MSNSNNNSNENEINEDNYSEDTHEDTYEEQDEQDEIDIPLITIPDEIQSRKSKHREHARESSRDRDIPVKKLHSKLPGKSSLKRKDSNEKFTGVESDKEGSKECSKEGSKEGSKEKSFFSKYRWYILVFFILLCIGLYFLWTKKLKMMFQSGGGVSTNSSNQTLDLNLLDSMNKNI